MRSLHNSSIIWFMAIFAEIVVQSQNVEILTFSSFSLSTHTPRGESLGAHANQLGACSTSLNDHLMCLRSFL